MSIIYDALQKTQKNREVVSATIDASSKDQPDRRLKLALAFLLPLVAVLVLALIYFIYKSQSHPVSPAKMVATKINPLPVRVQKPLPNKANFVLNGTFISDQSKIAMINDQMFKIGDHVDGMEIVDIQYGKVKLKIDNMVLELR